MKATRIACALLLVLTATAADKVAVRYSDGIFQVEGWKITPEPSEGWASIFQVSVGPASTSPQPMLGTYSVDGGVLTFRPRWPIGPGLRIVAWFHPTGEWVVNEYTTPKPDATPTTRVAHIYPSTGDIPSNALRMYICFSAPMSRGDVLRHIHLLDESGKPIEHALLEQELWDTDNTRLTVLFDPARIKRGLVPRQQLGPNLTEGRSYALEIDRAWIDAAGAPLVETFRKTFRVLAEDRAKIEPAKWGIATPKAGTRDPLVVTFPKPMDYALALRTLTVTGVRGVATLDRDETEWRFVPDASWKPGEGRLSVNPTLEDLAGNRTFRPFDANMHGIIGMTAGRTISVAFRIEEQ